jgi:hypothetical protein
VQCPNINLLYRFQRKIRIVKFQFLSFCLCAEGLASQCPNTTVIVMNEEIKSGTHPRVASGPHPV